MAIASFLPLWASLHVPLFVFYDSSNFGYPLLEKMADRDGGQIRRRRTDGEHNFDFQRRTGREK